MIFKKKPVAEIHIERGEDGIVRSSMTGITYEVANALCCALTACVIENRTEDASRGEVRDMLLNAVGAHFDDQWTAQVLEGQK